MIEDYVASGFIVEAVVGIDGSPTCGVGTRIGIGGFLEDVLGMQPAQLDANKHNDLVRKHALSGPGLFTDELRRELLRRRLDVPYLVHDLLAELAGARKQLAFPAAVERS